MGGTNNDTTDLAGTAVSSVPDMPDDITDPTPIPGLREVVDADGPRVTALIGGVFDEYPGCVLDLDDLDADLVAPRTSFAAAGARLWVVERDGDIVACAGVGDAEPGDESPSLPGSVGELKRLYVRADQRGRGLGSALIALVHRASEDRGHQAIELWSDTRFHDAHRRYEAAGYERRPVVRELHDPSNTSEYTMWRPLRPTSPTRSVMWQTPTGMDRCHLVSGPQHQRLTGIVLADAVHHYDVVADAAWCTRMVRVHRDDTEVLRLAADGLGHWWRDGVHDVELDGCLDIDLGPTYATNTLPVRRSPAGSSGPVAWWDPDTGDVRPVHQTYANFGAGDWTYESPSWIDGLQVDDDGLVVRYGDSFRRR